MKFTKLGICTTIQDLGRNGLLSSGINKGGVLDYFSFRKANLILGNVSNEAAFEMFFPGPEIIFEEEGVLAISGGDFEAELNSKKLLNDKTYEFKKGEMLIFRRKISGNVAYLGIKGGVEVGAYLGSASTSVGLCFNILEINESFKLKKVKQSLAYNFGIAKDRKKSDACFSVVFNEKINKNLKLKLSQNQATIQADSNRMGYRLIFEKPLQHNLEPIISTFVQAGTIQLLPSGDAIILMADAQVTGGYPILGFISSSELGLLAQKVSGEKIKFKEVTLQTAQQQILELENELSFISKNIEIWK